MSSDESWDLGLSLCMLLNKSLDTFIYLCWLLSCIYSFHMDFEVVFETCIYSFIIQVYFPKLFLKERPYRHNWYRSLSLKLELARIGSSDLGGLCVCEGPCRWISESVWVSCYFLVPFTIDWHDWLHCSELASWLLLIDCCFAIVWLLHCYWLACLCG